MIFQYPFNIVKVQLNSNIEKHKTNFPWSQLGRKQKKNQEEKVNINDVKAHNIARVYHSMHIVINENYKFAIFKKKKKTSVAKAVAL